MLGNSKQDIEAAVAFTAGARQTHVDWLAWLAAGGPQFHSVIGDQEHHRQCIERYDHVLAVLKEL